MAWDLPSNAALETVDSTRFRGGQERGDEQAIGRLTSVHPQDLIFSVDLGAEATTMGRSPGPTSPPLNHQTVSREHFVIEWDPTVELHVGRDCGSRNGSWVDGVEPGSSWQPIENGSIVRIGDVVLVYEDGHTLSQPAAPEVSLKSIPGQSLTIRGLRSQVARAAPDVSPALIIGETGTGKEKIAQELHRLSGRQGEFVAINCATFGEQLIESQLFGHVKGAFTGATNDQPGLFKAAEEGTLFLDEIGEMPRELQPKLLRAIQEREVRAVGSTQNISVDVRVVAATHQDLAAKAHSGDFRQDLYARLALWQLEVPAVHARRVDILDWIELLHSIWLSERGQTDQRPLKFDADAAELLSIADWPENLRGLNRLVHEISSASAPSPIRRRDLPSWVERE